MTDDKFVTDIQSKANIFNKYFADQCTPLTNDCILSTSQMFLTPSRVCILNFSEAEIIKIIRNLNEHKAQGHDDISVRMIKICDKSILKPLILLLKNYLNHLIIQIYEKDLILYLSIKRMINDMLITTDQYLYYPYLVKFLKK